MLPVNNQQLIATVPGSTGTIDVPAPSGGFPVGTNFQYVNVYLYYLANSLSDYVLQSQPRPVYYQC